MIEFYNNNEFSTNKGRFTIQCKPQGSTELLQNGVPCISGYDLVNRILYIRSDINGLWKADVVKSFIKAVNENRI